MPAYSKMNHLSGILSVVSNSLPGRFCVTACWYSLWRKAVLRIKDTLFLPFAISMISLKNLWFFQGDIFTVSEKMENSLFSFNWKQGPFVNHLFYPFFYQKHFPGILIRHCIRVSSSTEEGTHVFLSCNK